MTGIRQIRLGKTSLNAVSERIQKIVKSNSPISIQFTPFDGV